MNTGKGGTEQNIQALNSVSLVPPFTREMKERILCLPNTTLSYS